MNPNDEVQDPLPGNEEFKSSDDYFIKAPKFVLPSSGVPFIESAKQIFSVLAPAHRLFRRGGVMVEVIDGQLETVSPDAFRCRLEDYGYALAKWMIKDKAPALCPSRLPVESAKALMATEQARSLAGISIVTECSIISPTGTILGPGYHDHGGGVYITSAAKPVEVLLDDSIRSLWMLLDDFDFFSPGDRARAMSAIVTPALRMARLIPGRGFSPIDVAEANESQSGKGYRHDLNLAVYGTTCYQTAQRSGGVGSVDESLQSALFSGQVFVRIDNYRGELNSPFLESFMTNAGRVNVRIPYHGEVGVDARSTTVQLSSNGFEATQDFVNRACFCRIRKRPAGYQFSRFKEGDLIQHVAGNQPYYLGCVFTVIQEWLRTGSVQTDESRHDFKEWARILDHIVGSIMGAGVGTLMAGHGEATARTSNPALTWLRSVGLEILRRNGSAQVEWRAHELAGLADDADIPWPTAKNGDSDAAKTVGKIMAKAFEAKSEISIEEMIVTRVTRLESDGWGHNRENKAYTFSAIQTAQTTKLPEPSLGI